MLTACGGGGGSGGGNTAGGGGTPTPTPTTAGCALSARQSWVLGQLNEWYLFPTLFDASVNPANHATVQSYIDALVAPARAQNKDRYFTYITSIAEENAFYQSGATAGFGIRLGYDTSANRVFVIEAFEGANALAAGMDRASADPLTPFRYQSQAQRHCPADVVVWLDFRKGIYYAKGQRNYARGFSGSFVCRTEARQGGYRRSLLGLR